MAEPARPRPVEYYSPRPLILGLCFCWGVVIGFGLYYFRPPESLPAIDTGSGRTNDTPSPAAVSNPAGRFGDAPAIASIEPTPSIPADSRPSFLASEWQLPPPLLTTDGGLTGRNAQAPIHPSRRPPEPAATPSMTRPPPLPELMP